MGFLIIMHHNHFRHLMEEELWLHGQMNGNGCRFFKDWGPTYREDWCGFFNFPREVNMTKSGRLSFVPIRELKKI